MCPVQTEVCRDESVLCMSGRLSSEAVFSPQGCHLEVLFHLGANQDPKPCVLEISCTRLSLVTLEDLIWQRSVKVNQLTVSFCTPEVQ